MILVNSASFMQIPDRSDLFVRNIVFFAVAVAKFLIGPQVAVATGPSRPMSTWFRQ